MLVRRLILIVLSLILVLALLVSGCAPAQKGTTNVELLTTQTGSLTNVMAQALADIVNKNHPSVRITVTECLGTTDSFKRLFKMPSEQQKHTFVSGAPGDLWLMRGGVPPYDKSYIGKEKDVKFVANTLQFTYEYATLNPNVKTTADLAGKRINMGTQGTLMARDGEFLIYDCLGLKGKVQPTYLSFIEGKNALVDGTIDAYWIGGSMLRMQGRIVGKGNAPGDELVTTQKDKLHFIDITREDFERGYKVSPGYPVVWAKLPANSLAKGMPPEDTGMGSGVNAWFAHKNTDKQIIYEIVKVLIDNWQAFPEYHKASLQWSGPEFFSTTPFITEEEFHPGAQKAYKEYGLPMGGSELPFK